MRQSINTRTSGQCLEIEVRELKKTLTETLTRLERTHNGHEEENPVDSYPRTPRVEQGVDSILTPDKFERSRPPSSGVSTITVANTRRDTTTDKTSSYGSALSTCETAIGDWSGGTQHGNCSQIFVKGLTHRTLVIDMTAISTIDELKESLYNKTGILPDRISLRLDGRTLSWFNPDQLPNNATLLASINARTRLPLDTGEASMDDMDFTRYRLQKLRLDRLDPRTYRELDHILTYWWLHCGLDSLEDLNKNWERLALNQDLSDRARQILSKERNWLTDRAYIADYSCSTS